MKTRLLLPLLLAAVSLLLCGCKTEQPLQSPVTFYYRNADSFQGMESSILAGETREAGDRKADLAYLLNLYLQGPESETLLQVFPQGIRFVSYETHSGIAHVVLSDELARLEGISLSIACGCLAKTVMGLDDVSGVRIYAESQPLDHRDYIYMDHETLLLLDSDQAEQ